MAFFAQGRATFNHCETSTQERQFFMNPVALGNEIIFTYRLISSDNVQHCCLSRAFVETFSNFSTKNYLQISEFIRPLWLKLKLISNTFVVVYSGASKVSSKNNWQLIITVKSASFVNLSLPQYLFTINKLKNNEHRKKPVKFQKVLQFILGAVNITERSVWHLFYFPLGFIRVRFTENRTFYFWHTYIL